MSVINTPIIRDYYSMDSAPLDRVVTILDEDGFEYYAKHKEGYCDGMSDFWCMCLGGGGMLFNATGEPQHVNPMGWKDQTLW